MEESIRLRERMKDKVERITTISIGPPKSQDVLRTSMAMGADNGILVDTGDATIEPLTVAKILAKIVEREKSNLVILGKQAIDDDSGQTGQMLAGLLGWPQATQAAQVKVSEGVDKVEVTCEVDGGQMTVSTSLPAIITTDLRLNEPRYATLPNIMKAKKKPLEKLGASDLNVEIKSRLETIKVADPPPRKVRPRATYDYRTNKFSRAARK